MTQAQKTAKAKFKQAIAYRQKTGVSLKEAFAHIYGKKKVSAVNKKSASKKGYMNLYSKIGDIEKYNGTILGVKIGVKKILGKNKLYDLKIYDVNGNHSIINLYADDKESDIRNDLAPKLYKYIFNTTTQSYTSLQSDVLKKKLFTYLKLLAAELKRLNKKPIKKAVPKKKVAKKKVAKKVAKKKLTKIDYDKRYQAKKPGKRKSASGNTYYESRENRSDKGKLLGFNDITLTRINNDLNGNPRYVVHFLNVLNSEEQSFLPFNKKYEYALKKAKTIGGKKYDNKQYGGGIVFGSIFNSEALKDKINKLMQSTPKIKY
jgi:hypothetical protein